MLYVCPVLDRSFLNFIIVPDPVPPGEYVAILSRGIVFWHVFSPRELLQHSEVGWQFDYDSCMTVLALGSYLAAIANAYEGRWIVSKILPHWFNFTFRLNCDSTYLWYITDPMCVWNFSNHHYHRVLPMFHAAGWTYPWANVFSFATQVRHTELPCYIHPWAHLVKITLRTVNFTQIWNHLLHSGVTHYCGAPTVQVCLSVLNSSF